MEHLVLLVVILCTGYISSQEVKVDLSKHTAKEGDEVIFTCKVKDASSMVILGKMVNFFEGEGKTAEQSIEQITGGVEIYPKYTDTGRFSIGTTQEGDWMSYHLTISDVKYEDSANYACNILNTEIFGIELLEVLRPPKTIGFETSAKSTYGQDERLVLEENTDTAITCNVEEVVPLPVVHIKVGDKEVPTEQNVTIRKPDCYLNGYEGCLLHFSNDVSVTTNANLDYTADGKMIKCEAYVEKYSSEPTTMVANEIEILYSPKFKCSSEQGASLHQENAALRCIVLANPSLQAVMFQFPWNGETESLQPDSRTDDHEIHVTHKKLSDKETDVSLIIKKVDERHFMEYTLKASNQKGHSFKKISLVNNGSDTLTRKNTFIYVFLLSLVVYCSET